MALNLSSGKWNLIRNGVCNVTLELCSVLDDEIDATLKMRCNKTEPWVPDDCLKPLLSGVFIHSQPNPLLTKGPYLTPENPRQVYLDSSLKSVMLLGLFHWITKSFSGTTIHLCPFCLSKLRRRVPGTLLLFRKRVLDQLYERYQNRRRKMWFQSSSQSTKTTRS